MAVTNNLKVQVDTPVWEWCRVTPAATNTSAISCSCAADNSTFTVQHGRYIYFLLTASVFYRYDTITDSYQTLDQPYITPATAASMSFAGASGYFSRVISAPSTTTIQAALLTGQVFKGFDIRIIGGTGVGQQRTVTAVADSVIHDYGSASGGAVGSLTDAGKYWMPNQWVGYQVKFTLGTGAVQTRKIMYNTSTQLFFADSAKLSEDPWADGYTLATAPMAAPAAATNYQIESSVLTVDSAFSPALDATSRFTILTGGIWLASYSATSMFSLQYYDIAADMWFVRTANSGPVITTPTDMAIQRFGENCSIWDRGKATGGTTTSLIDTTKTWTTDMVGKYVRIISGTGVGQLRLISSITAPSTINWDSVGTAPTAASYYSIEGFDAGTASGATVCSDTASGTGTIAANIMTVSSVNNAFKPGMILTASAGMPGFVVATACTGAGTQAIVTCASTTGIYVGMVANIIYSTGAFAAGISTVISVTDSTHFVISQNIGTLLNAGVTGVMLSQGLGYTSTAGSHTGNSGQNVVTLVGATTAGLIVGMAVVVTTGTGAFVNTPSLLGTIVTVTAVTDSTHFTVSQNIFTSLSGAGIVISGFWPMTTYIVNQLTGTAGSDGTYTVFPAQTVSSTTITGKGIASLVDSSKTWTANRWNNMMVRITGGPGAGQTRSIIGTTPTTLLVNRDWTVTPTNQSTYVIHGDTDKILLAAGANNPTFLYNVEADLLTVGRALDYGAARGLSAQLLITGQTYGDTPAIHCASAAYTATSGATNITSGSSTATTITVGFSTTVFPVGSFVMIASASPAGFNGVFRVLSSAAGSATLSSTANPGAWASGGTIAVSASLLVTTTNAHNFMTGQSIALKGDYGVAASMAVNNANFADIFVNSTTTFTVGLPSASASATLQPISTARLVDVSKNWVINQWAGCLVTFTTGAPAQATGLATSVSIEIAANDTNCLYFKGTTTTPAFYATRYVITPPALSTLKNMVGAIDGGLSVQIGSGVGSADSGTIVVDNYKMWTSPAQCSSSGNTITIASGGTTAGLQVGMYVAVWAGTGTFMPGATAQVYTSVTVTGVTDATHFTVSVVPATTLSSATVQATFWPINRFNGRKIRIIGGTGMNQEFPITLNTGNILTATATSTAPVTGASTYAIIQMPVKGAGINMIWNFGQSDATKRGSYVYLPRGGGALGIDRLNLQTDQWEFIMTSPNFETLDKGSMYAYDGVDRLYFTKDATQRVYYYDLDKNLIHVAGTFPYIDGVAIIGNRMEIYETVDGLRYLWLSNHTRPEAFKTLLYF